MDTATVQTGADQAADTLAAKLKGAGWEVRTVSICGNPTRYSNGSLMIPLTHTVWVYADGPRLVGSPYLTVCWTTVTETAEGFGPAGETKFGDATLHMDPAMHHLPTEAEMNAWLDALIAVAAALDA